MSDVMSLDARPTVDAPARLVTWPFVTVTAAAALFFVYVGVLVPVVPRFVEDELVAGELGVGLNIAAFALAAVLARPLIGRLADRFGRRAVMVGGSLLAAAAGAAAGFVGSLGPLLALRGITGIGEAALFVGAATLIADLAPPHRRAEAASYFSVAVFGGLGVGPVIGEAILAEDRYRMAFVVAGGFAMLAAIASLGVPSRVVATEPDPDGDIDRPFVHPAAIRPGIVLGSGIAAFAVFSAFLPEHARDVGMSGSAGLFATYSVVCLALRIVGARWPERLGPRRSVSIALTAEGAAIVLLAAVAQPWALWVAAAVIGVGMAFMYPSLMALTVNRVDERERAAAVSSFTMFFEIGSAFGGVTLGLVAEVAGKRAGFLGGVAMCAFGWWFLRTHVVPERADDDVDAPALDAVFVPCAGD